MPGSSNGGSNGGSNEGSEHGDHEVDSNDDSGSVASDLSDDTGRPYLNPGEEWPSEYFDESVDERNGLYYFDENHYENFPPRFQGLGPENWAFIAEQGDEFAQQFCQRHNIGYMTMQPNISFAAQGDSVQAGPVMQLVENLDGTVSSFAVENRYHNAATRAAAQGGQADPGEIEIRDIYGRAPVVPLTFAQRQDRRAIEEAAIARGEVPPPPWPVMGPNECIRVPAGYYTSVPPDRDFAFSCCRTAVVNNLRYQDVVIGLAEEAHSLGVLIPESGEISDTLHLRINDFLSRATTASRVVLRNWVEGSNATIFIPPLDEFNESFEPAMIQARLHNIGRIFSGIGNSAGGIVPNLYDDDQEILSGTNPNRTGTTQSVLRLLGRTIGGYARSLERYRNVVGANQHELPTPSGPGIHSQETTSDAIQRLSSSQWAAVDFNAPVRYGIDEAPEDHPPGVRRVLRWDPDAEDVDIDHPDVGSTLGGDFTVGPGIYPTWDNDEMQQIFRRWADHSFGAPAPEFTNYDNDNFDNDVAQWLHTPAGSRTVSRSSSPVPDVPPPVYSDFDAIDPVAKFAKEQAEAAEWWGRGTVLVDQDPEEWYMEHPNDRPPPAYIPTVSPSSPPDIQPSSPPDSRPPSPMPDLDNQGSES